MNFTKSTPTHILPVICTSSAQNATAQTTHIKELNHTQPIKHKHSQQELWSENQLSMVNNHDSNVHE